MPLLLAAVLASAGCQQSAPEEPPRQEAETPPPAAGKQPEKKAIVDVKQIDPTGLGRQTIAAGDGWASFAGGTIGGSEALPEQVFVATSRKELVDALGGNNAINGRNDKPKIVYIKGTINLSADDQNKALGEQDYKDPGYDLQAYLKEYDPAIWGRKPPAGPLEEARKRSLKTQNSRVVINVGSKTTIIGLGGDAKIVGGSLLLNKVSNVIIRNIELQDAYDYFPEWDPADLTGRWNSSLDNVSLVGSTMVWIDHCRFNDGERTDEKSAEYFGTKHMHHDGLLDITQQSNYVTVSYNQFQNHDKVMLIGSSDSNTADRDKLKVTIHHNVFDNVSQRMPRVRYGQVHVYNNFYKVGEGLYNGSLIAGNESQIYAENNVFEVPASSEKKIVKAEGATAMFETGSLVNGKPVELVKAYNATVKTPVKMTVGWNPELHLPLDKADDVARITAERAGPGKLGK
jgi:pectate lyase